MIGDLRSQRTAYIAFKQTYSLQYTHAFYDYLKPLIFNLPSHSVRYDNLLLYNTCPDHLKQRVYKFITCKPYTKSNFSCLTPKQTAEYNNTWTLTGLTYIDNSKLTLNADIFQRTRLAVDVWKMFDKRHRPPWIDYTLIQQNALLSFTYQLYCTQRKHA